MKVALFFIPERCVGSRPEQEVCGLDLLSAHLTFRWVDLSDLEAVLRTETKTWLQKVRSVPSVEETVVLATCNRFEIYVATLSLEAALRDLQTTLCTCLPQKLHAKLRFMSGSETIRHLMRVASGIDSLMIGESEILHQVRQAYDLAKAEGAVGRTLRTLFSKAIKVGRRARTETDISEGKVSIGSAAVQLAEETMGSLAGRVILVLGAGEVAKTVAVSLSSRNPKAIFVANRTHEKAEELAKDLKGLAIRYEQLEDYLPLADVVIAATSAPFTVLTKEKVSSMLQGSASVPLLFIDLGNPRCLDPLIAELPSVLYRDLESLKAIGDANLRRRKEEIWKVERLIESELPHALSRFEEDFAEEVNKRLYLNALHIKERELRKAMKMLNGVTEEERQVFRQFADSLVGKLLSPPAEEIKKASREGRRELVRAATQLFRLEAR